MLFQFFCNILHFEADRRIKPKVVKKYRERLRPQRQLGQTQSQSEIGRKPENNGNAFLMLRFCEGPRKNIFKVIFYVISLSYH